jgi:hypothetical protein
MLRRPALYVIAALLAGACVPGPHRSSTVQIPPDKPYRAASPVPSDAAPVCAGGLSVRPGRLDVGAGHYLLEVQLVNCGGATIKIKGCPSVRVLDADQKQFAVTVACGSASVPEAYRPPARALVLRPGQSATTVLAWHLVVQQWSSAVQGTYLEITPADGYPAQLVTRYSPYNLGNTGRIAAGVWTAT